MNGERHKDLCFQSKSKCTLKDFSEIIMEEEGLLKDCALACCSHYSLTLDECNCSVLFMDVYHLKVHHIYSTENCDYVEFLKMLWLVALALNRFTFFHILMIVIFLSESHWTAVYKAVLPLDNRFYPTINNLIYRLAKRQQFRQVGNHYLFNNYKDDLHYAFHSIFISFFFMFFCLITLNWFCALSNEH